MHSRRDFFHQPPRRLPYLRRLQVTSLSRRDAESNAAWEKFLPFDPRLVVDHSLSRLSNNHLFLRFCESPLLIDDGRTLLERSGKKCWMLSARKLEIVWVDSPEYWLWISIPDSRLNSFQNGREHSTVKHWFEEVAALLMVCWFEIRGNISSSMLSKGTVYGAYLVFKEGEIGAFGFRSQPLETRFG
ncbi:hypothetical protein DY000_02026112 [Brassica cretica]|uniref:Uncharacterized protein n=1 Tax=Brassica cretica TaxID=69181 RepID=A0ABQ7ECX3_BRACR|nr:hypothetical protein DY000_02026112 [Brassica cretica]